MGMLDGKVAIVTGAGNGVGRGEAIQLADHGAKVVVNDLGGSVTGEGSDKRAADEVVDVINKRGGEAVANYDSVTDFEGREEHGRHRARRVRPPRHPRQQRRHPPRQDDVLDDAEEFDAVVKVHMYGAFNTMHHASVYWRNESKEGRQPRGTDQATYTLGDADVGATLRVVTSYTDGHGTAESVTSAATAAIANVNDAPGGGVSISGTATEDQVLTAVSTLTSADGLGTLHYQWQRDSGSGFANVGSDASTYTLGDADVGATVRVVTSYTDGHGTAESVTSAATAAIANVNDAPGGGVSISGTATEDQVLTAVSTLTDADGLGTLHYQWRRNSGSGFANVGSDASTYTLGDADVGATVRVVTSYTDGQGTAESVTSAATAAIANINDAPGGGVRSAGPRPRTRS